MQGKTHFDLVRAREWVRGRISRDCSGDFTQTIIDHWLLPPWLKAQLDPTRSDYLPEFSFRNRTRRNWTLIWPEKGRYPVCVDQNGIISLPGRRVSLEVWFCSHERLYTPADYLQVNQYYAPEWHGVVTVYQFQAGYCRTYLVPHPSRGSELVGFCLELFFPAPERLEQLMLLLVVRPYDHNGLAKVTKLHYEDRTLWTDSGVLLFLEKNPKHSYFSEARQGDVMRYFHTGEGNTGVESFDGSCTGLVGYSDLPGELTGFRAALVPGKGICQRGNSSRPSVWEGDWLTDCRRYWLSVVAPRLEMIQTGTAWDEILRVSLGHLENYSQSLRDTMDVFLMMALTRFGLADRIRRFLEEMLRRVRWDGVLPEKYITGSELLFLVEDYVACTGDLQVASAWWQVLKRLGYWLGNRRSLTTVEPVKGARTELDSALWRCAALKSLVALGTMLERIGEVQAFKEEYMALREEILTLWGEKIKITEWSGEESIRTLVGSFPLRLLAPHHPLLVETLEYIRQRYMYNGGILIPCGSSGLDLNHTARVGVALLRAGEEYDPVRQALWMAAGQVWNWPDRVHPVTRNGIGESGHDLRVTAQVMLFLRNILVMEEEDVLELLPGIFTSSFWKRPELELRKIPTRFGPLSLSCVTVGDVTQIDLRPNFRIRPSRLRIRFNRPFRLVFANAPARVERNILEINPGCSKLRICCNPVNVSTCLDNTFSGKI